VRIPGVVRARCRDIGLRPAAPEVMDKVPVCAPQNQLLGRSAKGDLAHAEYRHFSYDSGHVVTHCLAPSRYIISPAIFADTP
jgi:hypothetical protein